MQFLERDLEDIIFNTPNEKLQEKELYIHGKKKRQVRIGNYGIADLITLETGGFLEGGDGRKGRHVEPPVITIYELKQQKINIGTFVQALGYARGVQSYLNQRRFYGYQINIVLIGRELEKNSNFTYLPDFVDNLQIMTYSYDVEGILFNSYTGYKLVNEGFNIKNKPKVKEKEPF
jgi:hypothetical protein